MDYGHKWTDRELKRLEIKIAAEYNVAAKQVQKKIEDYLKTFEIIDARQLKAVADGEITEKQYRDWRKNQMLTKKRWEQMRNELARDYHNVNMIVASMTREFSYEAYAMNYNFGTYEVEHGAMIDTSFTLYDRSTVERLIRDDPDLLPPPGKRVSKKIAEGADLLWNKQVIQSVMLQGVLQGESVGQIADRLTSAYGGSFTIEDIRRANEKTAKQIANELARKNRDAAIRNARTMTTGAQNAGRIDSYKRAQNMGIKMRQEWIATLDNRTRHEHRVLDGQKVEVGQPFEVDGYTIRFPGDPQAAPEMVWNCRCTVVGVVAGTDIDKLEAKDLPRNSKLGDMSYEEWEKGHYQPKPKRKK